MKKDIVKMGGNPVTLVGDEVKVGDKAPDFSAIKQDLSIFSFYKETKNKVKVLSVAPSIDTSICDMQNKKFNEEASKLKDKVDIVSLTVDLPFAQKRYCAAEGIENIHLVSDHKDLDFGKKYGFVIEELRLLARGIVVVDSDGIVKHVEYVPEITTHPDYDKALKVVKELLK
ncbi:MAG: thiol peroxidase [Clostridiales bacterium]